jgi:hypothetical protein
VGWAVGVNVEGAATTIGLEVEEEDGVPPVGHRRETKTQLHLEKNAGVKGLFYIAVERLLGVPRRTK